MVIGSDRLNLYSDIILEYIIFPILFHFRVFFDMLFFTPSLFYECSF